LLDNPVFAVLAKSYAALTALGVAAIEVLVELVLLDNFVIP